MAKRTRARKRATGAPTKKRATGAPTKKRATGAPTQKRAYQHAHLPVSRRYTYTPELLADGRRRYEQTEEPVVAIAADFGIHTTTFQRMANREHWLRYRPPPRDLSPAAKLAAQAEAFAQAQAFDRHPEERAQRASKGDGPGLSSFEARAPGDALAPQDDGDSLPPPSDAADLPRFSVTTERLYRDLLRELAAVETMRAQLERRPQKTQDAERTARTLASLTATLDRIERRMAGAPQSGSSYDDDMPADLDAFRNELARRIDAFVASRTEPGDADGDAGAAVAEA